MVTGTPGPTQGFCRVALPGTWRAVLDAGRVPYAAGEFLSLVAADPSGTRAFGASYQRTWSGVVAARPGSLERRRIHPFTNPVTDQILGMAFDGRWLVWSETHTLTSEADWVMWSWDSNSGTVRRLGEYRRGADGRPVPGPLAMPVVRHGFAAWANGIGQGRSELHQYDLSARTDHVITDAHPLGQVFVGDLLLWRESMSPNALAEVRAWNVRTRQPATVPRALADQRGVTFLDANSHTAVWADWTMSKIWAARLPDGPRVLLRRQAG
ncbi:MAG: hypothetical protein ACOYY2_14400 [Actinomycetota bacterium]